MSNAVMARAPVRVSFGGGGTDLEAYYARWGGFVVSAAVTRYAYVVAREPRDHAFRINSADYARWETSPRGMVPAVEEPLSLPKAAIAHFAPMGLQERGVEMFLASEVPPGTGLGSSSAMAVALVTALSAYLGQRLGRDTIADIACTLEIDRLDMPIGRQDQYASAWGGLNAITFAPRGVAVEALELPADTISALQSRLLLFSTGQSRHSGNILHEQRSATTTSSGVAASLHAIKALAHEMHGALLGDDLDRFGHLLDEAWQTKKRLSGKISSAAIDEWYTAARESGALGGKITGAGGGGFLLLYCPVQRQDALRGAMARCGLREMAFDLDFAGAHLLAPADLESSAAPPPIVRRHVQTRNRPA